MLIGTVFIVPVLATVLSIVCYIFLNSTHYFAHVHPQITYALRNGDFSVAVVFSSVQFLGVRDFPFTSVPVNLLTVAAARRSRSSACRSRCSRSYSRR